MKGIRATLLGALGLAVAFWGGLSVERARCWDYGMARYRDGFAAGEKSVQEAAVREGHAAWFRKPDGSLPNAFQWLPRQPSRD
jgi:hypothetical protein